MINITSNIIYWQSGREELSEFLPLWLPPTSLYFSHLYQHYHEHYYQRIFYIKWLFFIYVYYYFIFDVLWCCFRCVPEMMLPVKACQAQTDISFRSVLAVPNKVNFCSKVYFRPTWSTYYLNFNGMALRDPITTGIALTFFLRHFLQSGNLNPQGREVANFFLGGGVGGVGGFYFLFCVLFFSICFAVILYSAVMDASII